MSSHSLRRTETRILRSPDLWTISNRHELIPIGLPNYAGPTTRNQLNLQISYFSNGFPIEAYGERYQLMGFLHTVFPQLYLHRQIGKSSVTHLLLASNSGGRPKSTETVLLPDHIMEMEGYCPFIVVSFGLYRLLDFSDCFTLTV